MPPPTFAERMAAKNQKDKAFTAKYGMDSNQYLLQSRLNAAKALYGDGANRTHAGENWSASGPVPERAHSPASVVAYHAAETNAKKAANSGNVPLAIKEIDRANKLQADYEKSRGLTPDPAHADSTAFRLQRRASFSKILGQVEIDPAVVAAKLTIDSFYAPPPESPVGAGEPATVTIHV
jgi:hypothetical protein